MVDKHRPGYHAEYRAAHRAQRIAYCVKYHAEHAEEHKVYNAARREDKRLWAAMNKLKYPERILARYVVKCALRTGELHRQACWMCGAPKAEAHHASYAEDMRLCVTWLCRKHHRQLHREFNTGIFL